MMLGQISSGRIIKYRFFLRILRQVQSNLFHIFVRGQKKQPHRIALRNWINQETVPSPQMRIQNKLRSVLYPIKLQKLFNQNQFSRCISNKKAKKVKHNKLKGFQVYVEESIIRIKNHLRQKQKLKHQLKKPQMANQKKQQIVTQRTGLQDSQKEYCIQSPVQPVCQDETFKYGIEQLVNGFSQMLQRKLKIRRKITSKSFRENSSTQIQQNLAFQNSKDSKTS